MTDRNVILLQKCTRNLRYGALMANQAETRAPRRFARKHRLRGLLVLAMGCLAVIAPFFSGSLALFLVGWLLIACGVLETLEAFRAPNEERLRSAYVSGMLS